MTALEYFQAGWNCAQSVFLAHAGELGLSEELARRLAAPFGAGLSGLRRTCGTVTALAMLEGLRHGVYPPGDARAKNDFYRSIRDIETAFAAEMGSSICKEILQRANCPAPPTASPRDAAYYARRPCERCVLLADELYAKRAAAAE